MKAQSSNVLTFGDFRLDLEDRLLLRSDGTEVPVTPRIFQTLRYLVEHNGRVLDKELIMEAVWPDCVVEENNLAQNISTLRRIFGDTPGCQRYIATVPGRGYRFVAEVHPANETAAGEIAKAKVASNKRSKIEAVPAISAASRRWRDVRVWLAVLVIVSFLMACVFFLLRNRTHEGATAPAVSAPANVAEKSVAVLPFDNLSDDKRNAFFAAGVQDEIISDLARIADLKVISRTSANLYKSGNPRNSREIGQQLGVAHLLEGSVQRIGNRLRVNAQLIRAPSDTHVWAQTYDRDVTDVFAVQSEMARAIADQLHAKISPTEKLAIEQPPTADLTAFDLYIHAKNLRQKVGFSAKAREDLLRAADLLNQAVAHDPSFLQAHCQLSQTHGLLYSYDFDHTSARLALAEAALAAASRLRPDAGETHLARAWNLYVAYRDYDGALGELELARQSLPNEPQTYELTAYVQRRQGRWEESIRSLERALELDPRNLDALHRVALRYRDLARYTEEKSVLDRALAIEPNDASTKTMHAVVELNWKADTRPLHQTIDEIRVKDPAALRSVADNWLICALAERDPAAAVDALAECSGFGDGPIQFSQTFLQGVIDRMIKDDRKAQSAFTVARAEQEKIVQAQPNYGPPLVVLGLIDAALGRKEEALREGRRAVELLPVEKDAVNGRIVTAYFAMIAAWVGDKALACEQLAIGIHYTSSLSYGQLKLMPFWDPIRGDPRFEKIVASLAPKAN
jgi:TolB-like protein/DNA-binding winged helix-turn-helix (wHTH) protein/Tfp pilus assembly protein PilF